MFHDIPGCIALCLARYYINITKASVTVNRHRGFLTGRRVSFCGQKSREVRLNFCAFAIFIFAFLRF